MNQIFVTFEESGTPTDGVRLDALITALDGVQDAVRLMVQHLGDRRPGPGQPPRWVQDQSSLRLKSTREGSFIAELALDPPPCGQQYLENYGEQAFDAFLDWNGDEDAQLPSFPAKLPAGFVESRLSVAMVGEAVVIMSTIQVRSIH